MNVVPTRSPSLGLALALLLASCGSGVETAGSTDSLAASATSDEFFEVTLSGPAYPGPQVYRVDPERVQLNLATAGGFTLMFSARDEPVVSADGSSALHNFLGNMGPDTPKGPGSYPVGVAAGGEGEWDVIVYPSGCERGESGCTRTSLRTEEGSMEVTRYRLGKGMSRPHEEGPTVLAGSISVGAREMGMEPKGRQHSVQVGFHLVKLP